MTRGGKASGAASSGAAKLKEGHEIDMGGMMMRAVKKPDGTLVYKPVAELDKAAEIKKGPKSDKVWVKEKQREVVKARDAEFKETKRSAMQKQAKTYGASEIYTRRSDRQGQVHVEVTKYLADLRLEEEQARRAQKDTKKPQEYRLIKEALDAEEAKYQQKVLKAREVSYARTRKRMGVRGGGKQDDSSDEDDPSKLSDVDFRKLCQARNDSANKDMAMSGGKLLKPIKAEPVPNAKKSQNNKPSPRPNNSKKELYNPEPSKAYVDPRSVAAQDQAVAEAQHWADLKEESDLSALDREQGNTRPASGRGGRKRDGKPKGGGKGNNSGKGGNKNNSSGNKTKNGSKGKGSGRGRGQGQKNDK